MSHYMTMTKKMKKKSRKAANSWIKQKRVSKIRWSHFHSTRCRMLINFYPISPKMSLRRNKIYSSSKYSQSQINLILGRMRIKCQKRSSLRHRRGMPISHLTRGRLILRMIKSQMHRLLRALQIESPECQLRSMKVGMILTMAMIANRLALYHKISLHSLIKSKSDFRDMIK